MSHVRISFDKPTYTVMTNGVGVINLLEILNNINKDIKFIKQVLQKCLVILLMMMVIKD